MDENTKKRLDQQFAFIREIDREKFIGRQTYLSDGRRKENDAEHAWHMAIMTMLLMKRFVKCFFELLTQIIVKVRKCKVQRVCVLHFQLAGSGGCFFLMKLYH